MRSKQLVHLCCVATAFAPINYLVQCKNSDSQIETKGFIHHDLSCAKVQIQCFWFLLKR